MSDTEYLTCAETAKLVRRALRARFPRTKFSVRSSTYSMGASIDVGWTDGPTDDLVRSITDPFCGAGFDGMIDLKTYSTGWLEEDGTATLAHAQGTEGSRGSMPEVFGSRRTPGARLVHFGADFIHTNRGYSPAFLARRAEVVARKRCQRRARWAVPVVLPHRDGRLRGCRPVRVLHRVRRERGCAQGLRGGDLMTGQDGLPCEHDADYDRMRAQLDTIREILAEADQRRVMTETLLRIRAVTLEGRQTVCTTCGESVIRDWSGWMHKRKPQRRHVVKVR